MLRAVLLSGICALSVALWAQVGGSEEVGRAAYLRAKRYFQYPQQTDQTDSLALTFYTQAARLLKPNRATAPLRFDSFEKIGILNQTFGNQTAALDNYDKAIATNRRFGLSDSLLFIPYLYSGSAHYFLHSFDSSSHYFEQAEKIYARYPGVAEAQRLFNSLGALYFEVGNYRQSINYFQKALQLYQRNPKQDSAVVFIYKSNIASSLRHLEQYDSAAVIYRSLIPFAHENDLLYINLGRTYLDKREPARALLYLAKADANGASKVLLENVIGTAYLQLGQYANAETHLRRSLAAHGSVTARRTKNDRVGLTYKLLGDLARQRGQLGQALTFYQRSIIELDYNFGTTDVRKNPANFTQNFGGYLLFDCLAAKADCWLALYHRQPDKQRQGAVLDTYRSALRLAEHIEKSFDNEEARLFVVQKVYPVSQQAVNFLVNTYEATRNEAFLTEAFQWSEKSKAAVLAITLKENRVKTISGIPDSLLSRERDLRYNLSRLLLRSQSAVSVDETERLSEQIRDTEVNLSRLIDNLHDYPNYYRQKFSFDSLNVGQLRRNLLGSRTALLSYFATPDAVFGFVVTQEQIRQFRFSKDQAYEHQLSRLLTSLQTIVPGRPFAGNDDAQRLYDRLIGPARPYLSGIRSLIIVPHDELRLLPFEVLQHPNRQYLLESYDITYQYSATFLQNHPTGSMQVNNALAVAPFDGINPGDGYVQLTASRQEIESLKGTKLLGAAATKAHFLAQANEYSIIHLATHAVVNNADPQRSYVAFHPAAGPSHRLYAHELTYGLLPRAQLVFLSACETASGKLIRGEGIMSLSRAFSFAGCPNLVTSLWKAEDNATAYISTRFYRHLRAGHSFAKALQRAKLDLLHNPQYAQFHSPQYWSHLVFIGTPGRSEPSWLTYLFGGVLTAGLIGLAWWYTTHRKTTRPAGAALG